MYYAIRDQYPHCDIGFRFFGDIILARSMNYSSTLLTFALVLFCVYYYTLKLARRYPKKHQYFISNSAEGVNGWWIRVY